MAQITYTDKVTLNINPSVPDINKFKGVDANEVKNVVNTNDNILSSGWYPISDAMSYVSEDSPTYNVNLIGDYTDRLTRGNKMKFDRDWETIH